MKFNRSSGIILHPSSLPGPYGIGDIGPQAERWLNFLHEANCGLWQVLPLGPTGYGDSPYQCFSAFAGNPYLISPEALLLEGLLKREDLEDMPHFPEDQVDFGSLIPWKVNLLDRAYRRFESGFMEDFQKEMLEFQAAQVSWLEDFSLFMAIKESLGGIPWSLWPAPLRDHQPDALVEARKELFYAIQRQVFRQFLFFRQWGKLHEQARQMGIYIIGDVPIFVAHDSSDVWAHPELFFMGEAGQPSVVAGVPPDYFSLTGQLWGNPLYRWDIHEETGYAWWIDRFRAVLQLVDIVRLDHFRGFAAYWEIPAGNLTAENGHWVPGPGKGFFEAVRKELGSLPIIAEDLGIITPDVVELREDLDLPGMRVLQFAFASRPTDLYLPHNYVQNCVAYTGTHDNDTSTGWFATASEAERKFCLRYLHSNGKTISWDMIRAIWESVAEFALAPMQDFLSFGSEARMNCPGHLGGNWTWRMPDEAFDKHLCSQIQEIHYLYARSVEEGK